MSDRPWRRVRLLGGDVDLVTPAEVMAFIEARVGRGAVIANHNLHSLRLLAAGAPGLARFYAAADLIEPDSMPLIAWGALLGRGLSQRHRCTYLDWREAFWERAQAHGWRVFHLGGAPGVGERAIRSLLSRRPGLRLASRHGFFAPGEGDAVAAEIRAFVPDVLFVGMGMPRQELWIEANRARLTGLVVLPVGAAFDYEAGVQATPPRWSGRLGLEWLFRLAADPARLSHRYLIEPWALAPLAWRDLFGRAPAARSGA